MDWKEIISNAGLEEGGRLRLVVRGRVQGVGFRPSIYRFAERAGVSGSVRNTGSGVVIEIEGEKAAIDAFGKMLSSELPPMARIDSVEASRIEPVESGVFVIEESDEAGTRDAIFPVDTAVCGDCLREMADPDDPRYRYPFINCTNCGPRFTIIEGLPYDRPLTTMKDFSMDPLCSGQYGDPGDRRFHAEPISCPDCGPRLSLLGADSTEIAGDPIDEARKIIGSGGILALKGLGGYHLACMATDGKTVELLRERKRRPSKPFALMFSSLETVREYCLVTDTEEELLTSPEAPIVLLQGRERSLPLTVAPRNRYIGAFLPYTPVHHMIIRDFDVLVMTSANYTDEPLISTEEEVAGILGTIADAALVNDRRIAHKCDDSIIFAPGGVKIPLRRARGFVPEPVRLPQLTERCILGVGGQDKGTFTLTRGDSAFVSPHLGDLGDARGQENYRKEYEAFCEMLEVRPDIVVCDMHPDYFTTRFAEGLDCPMSVAVQHHHAHAVSVMVEYGLEGPVIGVSFDGTGFGTDGNLWGGEFLLAWHHDFKRLAHLKYVPLPGGAVAVREPWRMALSYLREVYGDEAASMELPEASFAHLPATRIFDMIDRNINTHMTSSAGRLFDAVACILGLGYRVSYEAEAAIALESIAPPVPKTGRMYPFTLHPGEPAALDCGPVIEGIVTDLLGGMDKGEISTIFHNTMARMITDVAGDLARRHGCRHVVLSGGVFQNRLLCERIIEMSTVLPFDFLFHRTVPPNDGGISLGQVQAGLAKMIEGLI